MGNEHHGEEEDNLGGDTLHDTADTRGCVEGVLHNHAVDEFYQLKSHHQEGCDVWKC